MVLSGEASVRKRLESIANVLKAEKMLAKHGKCFESLKLTWLSRGVQGVQAKCRLLRARKLSYAQQVVQAVSDHIPMLLSTHNTHNTIQVSINHCKQDCKCNAMQRQGKAGKGRQR